MKNLKKTLGSVLFAFICASAGGAPTTDQATQSKVLAYSSEAGQHPDSLVLTSPTGHDYRLSLIPEKDTAGRIVVLELSLQQDGSKDEDVNLLDTTGNLHGYQPYFFAASDFAHGAQKSVYGDHRNMEVRNLGMRVQVKIVSVAVKPISTNSTVAPQYQFSDLRLQVSTRPFAR